MKWDKNDRQSPIPSLSKQLNTHKYRSRISQKLPGFQSERHNRIVRKLIINLTVFIIIIIIMIYFISPLSKISSIDIKNQNHLSKELIQKNLKISNGDSIFKFIGQRKKIIKKIYDNDPYVKHLNLKIIDFNHIIINSSNYDLIGYSYSNHNYYPIMSDGRIYNHAIGYQKNLPVMINFNSDKKLHKLIDQYKNLPTSIKRNIIKIEYLPNQTDSMRIHLIMHDGNQVYAKIDTLTYKMSYYFSITKSLNKNSIINFEIGAYSYPQK